MLYYYLDGLDKKGPYTSEELKSRNLRPETLVFFDGMDSWKPIKEIELLNSILFEKPIATEASADETNSITEVLSETPIPELTQELDTEKEPSKIRIPSILFLLLFYGISIGISYFIVSSQEQNDLNEINKKIDGLFKGKSAITDYTFDGSSGQLYDVYLSPFFEGIGDDKNIVKTKKRTLAYKPTSNNSESNKYYYESQLKQWNAFKDLVQYYECEQFSGFDVIRIEKNLNTFSIIKSWSGDMAYKVPESRHYAGYSNEYYSSPGYDIPTNRPSISKCYEEAAKFLTSEKEDKSYEAGSYSKISSFPYIETKFYEISQYYPKYTKLLDKIHIETEKGRGGDVIDNAKITNATSATDANVYNNQWIVWYKSMTNTYFIEEKKDILNKYWLTYSAIGIAIATLVYLILKYRKRISLN